MLVASVRSWVSALSRPNPLAAAADSMQAGLAHFSTQHAEDSRSAAGAASDDKLAALQTLLCTLEPSEQSPASPGALVTQLRRLADSIEASACRQPQAGNTSTSTSQPTTASQLAVAAVRANSLHGTATSTPTHAATGKHDASAEEPVHGKHRLTKKQRRGEANRVFDIKSYQKRYVALEVAYFGGTYLGFASQEVSENTIEGHLFGAMRRARLLAEGGSWRDAKYSRCGRTDKGVSALTQVVALELRSAARAGAAPLSPEQEHDFPLLINRCLPPDIRVLGWTDVPDTFSARFSARSREYKYFFIQDGSLDIAAMQQAADLLVGEHDFRNFCKADAAHIISFWRRILDFRIQRVEGCALAGRGLYALHVRGTAFLWHQVRCMAAVLLMVGRGLEAPDVMTRLLDTDATPAKPQYNMAEEGPLILYGCSYEGGLFFRRSSQSHAETTRYLQETLSKQLIAAGMTAAVYERVAAQPTSGPLHKAALKQQVHVQLANRHTEPPVEGRFAKYGKSITRDAQTPEISRKDPSQQVQALLQARNAAEMQLSNGH